MTSYNFLPSEPITDPVQLIDQIRHIIEYYPYAHDQEVWVKLPSDSGNASVRGGVECGTTACVAGWITLLTGFEWHHREHADMWGNQCYMLVGKGEQQRKEYEAGDRARDLIFEMLEDDDEIDRVDAALSRVTNKATREQHGQYSPAIMEFFDDLFCSTISRIEVVEYLGILRDAIKEAREEWQ